MEIFVFVCVCVCVFLVRFSELSCPTNCAQGTSGNLIMQEGPKWRPDNNQQNNENLGT